MTAPGTAGRRGRLVRLALRAYPARFRQRHGQDLLDLYRDAYGDAGGLRFGLRVAADAAWHGLAVRWGALRQALANAAEDALTARRQPPRNRHRELLAMTVLDLRHAARGLRRRPAFSALVVLTLALGIGATSALFSVVDAVLLRPLPFPEADRLVRLWGTDHGDRDSGTIAYLDFVDWRQRSQTLAAAAAYDEWRPSLTGDGEPERIDAALVSASFFEVLGVRPAAGRFFLPEEDVDGNDRVVVLAHGLWQRKFGGDPAVIGRALLLNGRPHTVVGVAPARFEDLGLSGARWGVPQVWRPLGFEGVELARQPHRGSTSYTAIARLADGVDLDAAESELRALCAELEAAYPQTNAGRGIELEPAHAQLVGGVRRALLVLLGAVACVLAIAAANVAGLLVGRAADRRDETVLRAVLGAGRLAMVRHALSESLLLALAGGGLGLLVALAATRALTALAADTIPRLAGLGVDGRALAFTAAVTVLTGLVCGLLPAWQASRGDLFTRLRAAGGGRQRARGALVVAEVALSLVLVTGAGLLLRSLGNLLQVDPGFAPRGVLAFDLAPPSASYPEDAQLQAFYRQLLEQLGALPGVHHAATVNILPLSGGFDCNGMHPDDRPPPPPGEELCAESRTVSPDYFHVMATALISGRTFTAQDRGDTPPVVVVSETAAELLWPGRPAVGRRLTIHDISSEVIGVVADVKHLSLAEQPPPQVYLAYDQGLAPWQTRGASVLLRTGGEPRVLAAGARRAVWALDAQLPVAAVRTLAQEVGRTLAPDRFRALLLAAFAVLALVLAATGVYGVMSYAIALRRRELAIRMALGARRLSVLGQVLRQGLALTAAGLAVGLALAWAATRVLAGLLYGVAPHDPGLFVAVPALILTVALVACWAPARRATRIDPMATLRAE